MISTSTGTVLDWISARTDMVAVDHCFPEERRTVGRRRTIGGVSVRGEVKDPLNARVTYERSLIAIRGAAAAALAFVWGGVGDWEASELEYGRARCE